MSKQRICLTVLTLLSLAPAAFALGGEHGKGDPKRPISSSAWPAGVTELVNRTDRIGGFWINQSDVFYYAGDAAAFNTFLARYAAVKAAPLRLVLQGWGGAPWHKELTVRYDWRLSLIGWRTFDVQVAFPLDGRIPLKAITVPANVEIVYSGEKSADVERFLAEHRARQSKTKDRGRPGIR